MAEKQARYCANDLCRNEFIPPSSLIVTCCPRCSLAHKRQWQRNKNHELRPPKKPIRCCWCDNIYTPTRGEEWCSEACRIELAKYWRNGKSPRMVQKMRSQERAAAGTASKAAPKVPRTVKTGKTDLQIAEEARAAGMSAGRYKAMLQMQYEKENGIGMYAEKWR